MEAKKQRRQVLISAAQITVGILHDLCFKCAVGAVCAARFYGSSKVPTALTMTVLRPENFSLNHTALANTILVEDPQHYYRHGEDLIFINRALFQDGQNSCKVTFTFVDGDLMFPIYQWLPYSLPMPPLSFLILLKLESWAIATATATAPVPKLGSPGQPNPANTKVIAKLLSIDPPPNPVRTDFTTFGEWNLEQFEAVAKRYSLVAPEIHNYGLRLNQHFDASI
ncbi:hypothetical protein BD779DRAFT_1565547 [Infundibulicybe gibba]|nr:hypothetical protein BD779DRAFT_1565547 [Infundibulicybe gibba]